MAEIVELRDIEAESILRVIELHRNFKKGNRAQGLGLKHAESLQHYYTAVSIDSFIIWQKSVNHVPKSQLDNRGSRPPAYGFPVADAEAHQGEITAHWVYAVSIPPKLYALGISSNYLIALQYKDPTGRCDIYSFPAQI